MKVCSTCGNEHDEATCPSCRATRADRPAELVDSKNEPKGNFSWMTQLRDDPISIEETPVAFMADELYGEEEATKQLSRDEIEKILATESQAEPPQQDVLDKADPHRRISVSSSEVQAALKDAGKVPVPPPPPVLDQPDAETAAEPAAPRPVILPAPARKAAAELRSLPSEEEAPEPPSAVFHPPSIEVEAAEPPSLEFALGKLAKSAREEVEESSKPVSAVVQAKAVVVPQPTGGVGRWVVALVVLIIVAGVGAALFRDDPVPKKLAGPRYHQPAPPVDVGATAPMIDAAVNVTPDVATPDTARPDTKTKQSVDAGAAAVDAATVVDTMKKKAPRPKVKKVRPKKRPRKPKRPRRPKKPRKPKRPKTIDPFSE